jgi:hypothetical protein
MAEYGLGNGTAAIRGLVAALRIACRYKSPTFQGMCLVLATVICLGGADPERATEHLGYCFAQPAHLTAWLHHWPLLNELRGQLQAKLGDVVYAAAWARGRALDLNMEAAKLLAELEAIG